MILHWNTYVRDSANGFSISELANLHSGSKAFLLCLLHSMFPILHLQLNARR